MNNLVPSIYIPVPIRIVFGILIGLNMYVYKKYKISRYLEERFTFYPMTFASLSFILYSFMLAATYGRDIFLEVFSTILGIAICGNYMSNIVKDAKSKLKRKWLIFLIVFVFDLIVFYLIPIKVYPFIFVLIQCIICMIYESKKSFA